MDVSATVTRTCTVEAAALAFGTVVEAGATSAQSAISVSCTAGSTNDAPTITFSNGLNQAVPTEPRNMIGGDSGAALIPYTLSGVAAGANLAPSASIATTAAGGGTSYSTTVYGSIAGSTGYEIGSFADTVTVTVTYAN